MLDTLAARRHPRRRHAQYVPHPEGADDRHRRDDREPRMKVASKGRATEVFVEHRNLLFTVAYEMLGSAADSEDVLQEA
jgi:hypothetical protein